MRRTAMLIVLGAAVALGGCFGRSVSYYEADPATKVLYWSKQKGWGQYVPPFEWDVERHPDEVSHNCMARGLAARAEVTDRDDLIEVSAVATRVSPGRVHSESFLVEDALAEFATVDPPSSLASLRRIVLLYPDRGGEFVLFKLHHSYTFRFTPDGEFFDIRGGGGGPFGPVVDLEQVVRPADPGGRDR